jgi:hypothetical protein
MNKKGQAESVIIFVGLIVAILIISILILRITNEILTPFANQMGTLEGGNESATQINNIHNSFTGMWDWVVLILFFFNVILLLVSAFMVDIHPAFLLVYIIAIIFLVIFMNTFAYVLDSVWGAVGTSVETAQTPLQQFLINNFSMIILGIIFLSGVVMYSKFKYFGGQGAGGNY